MGDDNGEAELNVRCFGNTSWDDLAPELLQMIFRMMAAKPDPWKKALLNCRLINRHWKSSTDKILEDTSLKNWTTWEPSNRSKKPLTFPSIPLIATTSEMSLDWMLCPEFLLSDDQEDCTIPTKSICLQYSECPERPELNRKYKLTTVLELFPKCGTHLFCLEIFNCSIAGFAFCQIIQNVPNLKTLTIGNVTFTNRKHWYDGNGISLIPVESTLAHFKYVSKYCWPESREFAANVWLISSFAHQLVTLETDINFVRFLEYDEVTDFPKLKQLTVTVLLGKTPSETFTRTRFPLLERVGLVLCSDSNTIFQRILNTFQLVGTLANTVTHLHLQFDPGHTEDPIPQAPFPLLPKLKHLGISGPVWIQDWHCIPAFLQVCPRLETLKLFNFIFSSGKALVTQEVETNIVGVFRNIKNISIYLDWTEESQFFEKSIKG